MATTPEDLRDWRTALSVARSAISWASPEGLEEPASAVETWRRRDDISETADAIERIRVACKLWGWFE